MFVCLLCLLLLVAIIFALYYLWRTGLFYQITVKVSEPAVRGSWSFVYKYHTGSYKNTGPAFEQLTKLVAGDAKMVGIYYDDPKKVPHSELRWAAGVLVTGNGKSLISEKEKEKLLNSGYNECHLPAVHKAITSTFPLTTSMSPLMAVWRVYSKIGEFIEKNRLQSAHPAIEFYFHTDGEIHFCMPLENQDHFMVKESYM